MITIKFPRWIERLSLKLDKFFPGPTDEEALKLLHTSQKKIEDNATFIRRQISHCQTIEQCENIEKLVVNMKAIHGNTTQVQCWQDSLFLQIHNRKVLISK